MSRHTRLHHSSRQLLLAAVALSLVMGMLSAGPAAAHKFTRTDGNDTPGLLDLRSASVAHKTSVVVHSFRTFAGWAPSDLGRNSSFFVIGIDKNNDPRQAERCVLIFFAGRLRAQLINCITGSGIGPLPVSKPNRTTVKVNIPKAQTGLSYRWAVVSFYVEKRPCLNGCVDGIPNLTSFILHDLIPPTVSMNTATLRVWEADTDASFSFPFTVSDTGGSGVKAWAVQRHPIGSGSWTNVVSGTGGGAKNPTINGTEGTRRNYRVIVTDKHGNKKVGPIRRVYIPTDDDSLDPLGFSVAPTPVPDATAFGGSYSEMAASDVFTYEFTPTGTDCTFELVGPGGGDWSVSVVADGGVPTVIAAPGVGDRVTLYSDNSCATTYEVTVDSGTGFGIDAVLG
jgi:hypothetical protein